MTGATKTASQEVRKSSFFFADLVFHLHVYAYYYIIQKNTLKNNPSKPFLGGMGWDLWDLPLITYAPRGVGGGQHKCIQGGRPGGGGV